MSDHAVRLQLEAAFDAAKRHIYSYWKAERTCELDDRVYKRYDGRGFHTVSLEAGRLFALVELCPDLSDRLELNLLRQSAREDAQAEWRERVFAEFLPAVDVGEAAPGSTEGSVHEHPDVASPPSVEDKAA